MTELNKPIKERRFHTAMLSLVQTNDRLVKRNQELIKENEELQKKLDTIDNAGSDEK